jgi:hypothetical protein
VIAINSSIEGGNRMQVLGLILIMVAIYVIGINSNILVSSLGAISGIVGLAILIKVKHKWGQVLFLAFWGK